MVSHLFKRPDKLGQLPDRNYIIAYVAWFSLDKHRGKHGEACHHMESSSSLKLECRGIKVKMETRRGRSKKACGWGRVGQLASPGLQPADT